MDCSDEEEKIFYINPAMPRQGPQTRQMEMSKSPPGSGIHLPGTAIPGHNGSWFSHPDHHHSPVFVHFAREKIPNICGYPDLLFRISPTRRTCIKHEIPCILSDTFCMHLFP